VSVTPTPTDDAARRIEGLDVIRGIAIGLVLLRHAWPDVFKGAGVAGIVVFFALSGYLITGVLLRELQATGRVRFRRFYARRARRLFPALIAMTAGFVVVTLTADPLGDRPELLRSAAVALTYTADLPFHHGSLALFHLWTLAVEEQFYLVWPAVLAVAWSRRTVAPALALAAATSLIACLAALVWLWPESDLAYPLPTSWSLCFVLGAAARIIADGLAPGAAAWPSRRTAAVSALAVTALAVASMVPLRGHALTYLVGGPVIAGLTCVLLVAWRSWLVVAPRVLRPLVALGAISYGVYLWNYPVTLWLRPSIGPWAGGAGIALSIAAAAISWRLVERPVMRRGRPVSVPSPTRTAT
jgi:peptidoglycan/LPS O-acetylase OafA/YrhL